ncbi:ubiquitin-conjugating enzyme, variant 2 [Trifolium repens]|nr:ubiquitin-conjugating enzyme, variant 2 [Trifolium repens]
MDPDVVEIPPPLHQKPSRFKKLKHETVFHDVIDLEGDDDLVVLGETSRKSTRNKGKAVETNHGGYSDHQVVPGFAKSGIQPSNGQPLVSHDYLKFSDDYMDVDEYALLQAQFDSVDLPTGIEVPITLLPEYDLGLKKTRNSTLHLNNSNIQGSKMGSSSLQNKMDNVDRYSGTKVAPNNKKSVESQHFELDINSLPGDESSMSRRFTRSFDRKVDSACFGSKKQGLTDSSDAMKLPHGGLESRNPWLKSSYNFNAPPEYVHPQGLESINLWSKSSYNFNAPPGYAHPQGLESRNPWLKSSYNFNAPPGYAHPHGLESRNPWLKSSYNFNAPPEHPHPHGLKSRNPSLESSYNFNAPPEHTHNGASMVSPSLTSILDEPESETLRKLRCFKQFDIVVDTSDHYFVNNNSSMQQNPKIWAKKIQDEWKILEKHLPETIFVRVFQSRMDLLRAVIIGAEGTPYHDGLFFFDVLFPSGYPNVPPQVHYHAGGLRLNPNLYASGKVCLGLLNTWHGNMNEMWTPGVSTMLQVLVSMQGLILNAKPYFNEPGCAYMSGTQSGEAQSLKYNENTFILSVRTMMYTIKRPPKNFEEFVGVHFYSRAHDILASCNAYMEGVQDGCFVKGGVRGC